MQENWLKHPFIHYIKKFHKPFNLGVVALFITNGFDIMGPFIIGKLIDALPGATLASLKLNLFLLLCVSVGTAVFRYLWRIYFGRFHHEVAADLRKVLFQKMMNLGQNFHQKTPTGEKMTLLTQDIENFRMGIGPGLLILFDAIIYVFALIPLMLLIDIQWTWQCLALMPLIPFVIYKLENTLNHNYRQLQDETGELTSFTQETVSGIKVIKSLGLNSLRLGLFDHTNRRLKDYGIKVDKIESAFGPALEFFVMIGTATLLFVGAEKVVSKQVSVGDFFAFYQYLLRMIWPMTALGFSFMMYKEADSSFDRIKDILTKEPWLPEGQIIVKKGLGLSIRNLGFQYSSTADLTNLTLHESKFALQNISFNLKPGESMAIVGPVGSGKTTLVQLIASILPPTEGEILYGETKIQDLNKIQYRTIAALVPQRIFLFKKSIKDNVLDFLTPSPHNKSFATLAQEAHIYDEIQNLPNKENTVLEENGQGLSGGQRQRLALARGLALQPQWLLLDDTLSAVDIETEQNILKHMRANKSNETNYIFCSHRIQSLSWVDKILVLDQGQLVDSGDHETLMARSQIYRGLYSSQKNLDLSKKETTRVLNSTKELL